jgi:hypothetical protein
MSVLNPVLNTPTSTVLGAVHTFLTCSIEMFLYKFFHFYCKRKGSGRYSIKVEFIFPNEDIHVCMYCVIYCTVFHIKSTISQNYVLSFFLFPELCKLICSQPGTTCLMCSITNVIITWDLIGLFCDHNSTS